MHFRRKIVRITLLTLISTLLGVILGAFHRRIFQWYSALTYQNTLLENSKINQDAELAYIKEAETIRNSPTENLDILKFDRSTSGMAHSAQLTLISILVGAILGALFIGLPNGFVINIWSKSNPDLDLRVLTVFLAAIDIWIKYSWAVLVVRWPFSLLHNFTFFFVTGTIMCWALSVGYYNSWLAWGAMVCLATFFVYIFTLYTVLKEKISLHRETVISEDPPYEQKELNLLSGSSIITGLTILLAGLILLYTALNAYQALPIWARLSYSPTLIGGLASAFVALDLLLEGAIFIPREKYGSIPSPDRLYKH